VDNAIHQKNHYPVDSVVWFVNTYPLDSDLFGGLHYQAFQQMGPGCFKFQDPVITVMTVMTLLASLIPCSRMSKKQESSPKVIK